MPVATWSWKAGDTERIETTLRDRGQAIPLQGALVRFHARNVQGGATETVLCTVLDPELGIVDFPPPALFTSPGVYLCEWEVTFQPGLPTQTEITVPNGNADGDDYERFEVRAGLA